MRLKNINKNGDKVFVKTTPTGYETWNVSAYTRHNPSKREYTIDEIPVHKITEKVRDAYYTSPWHMINNFKYKGRICTVKKLIIVYDAGYVIKLIYNNGCRDVHTYVKNVNSLKYLSLLKLKDIEII
jgi:hypothetical protein